MLGVVVFLFLWFIYLLLFPDELGAARGCLCRFAAVFKNENNTVSALFSTHHEALWEV